MVIKRLFILSSLLTLFSCAGEYFVAPEEHGEAGTVRFDLSSMTRAEAENTNVHVFNGTAPDMGGYVYRVPGLTWSEGVLSMDVRVGTWNMVLVNAPQAALSKLVPPVAGAGATMYDSPMWKTEVQGGVLPSAPQIMTAHLDRQQVKPDVTNTASTQMARNVAMVRVVVKEAGGFAEGGGTNFNHTVRLGNVPTTLSWAGGLLPDKDNPAVGTSPMSGELTILQDPVKPQNQISDTLTFIVPAHKGIDYLASEPADTTKNKLRLSIDFKTEDGQRYRKSDVEIPVTPKMNKILLVELSLKAQVVIETEIYDWTEKYVDTDIATQTTLEVDKTEVTIVKGNGLATVFVKSSSPDVTASTDAPWLSASVVNNTLTITTDPTDFTGARSSYVNVTANNLTKKIRVVQPNSITVLPPTFFVSPSTGNTGKAVDVDVSDNSMRWEVLDTPAKVTPDRSSGTGDGSVTFSRKSGPAGSDYSMFGNETVRIRNVDTFQVVTVDAQSLYLQVPEQINVNGSGGTSYNDDIVAWGGDGEYVYVSTTYNSTGTGWLTTSVEDGRLKTTAAKEPKENTRWCMITVAHADDPTYTVQVRVEQNPYYDIIDPFTYLTGKFEWDTYRSDMDIAVLIYDDEGNSIFPAGKWMGYGGGFSNNVPIKFRSRDIAKYGGDPRTLATATDKGESFMVYMNAFDDYTAEGFKDGQLTRYINIYVYAWWWSSVPSNGNVYLALQYWLGGAIVSTQVGTSSAYVFSNPTGENKNPDPNPQKLVSPILLSNPLGRNPTFTTISTNMSKVVRVRYDRLTHKATPVWYTNADLPGWPMTNVALTQTASAGLMTAEEMRAEAAMKEQSTYHDEK